MTTELTKAAQQAIAAIDALLRNTRRSAHQLSGKVMGDAENASAELRRALTQRPAAQTERESPRWTVSVEPVAVSGEPDSHCLRASIGNQTFHIGPDYMETKQEAEFFAEMFLHAIEVGHRATLPAPQQATPEPLIVKGAMAGMVDAQVRDLWPTKGATPEPVGESGWVPPTEADIDSFLEDYEMRGEAEDGRDTCYTPTEGERFLIKDAIMGLLADTRPAPGVPDGFVLVPVEPTPEMKAEGIKVEVYSEASDSIGALTWAEVAAIYRAMLAAAQAKGAQA